VSIVRLCKITLIGTAPNKQPVLEGLQRLGCLHVIPLTATNLPADAGTATNARAALRFLLDTPHKFPQVTRESQHFDAQEIEKKALELRDQLDALTGERDDLILRIAERRPWGDFKLPRAEELRGHRLWLYQVPVNLRQQVEASGLCWACVAQDKRFAYVTVISEHEPAPEKLPVSPLKYEERTLGELESRLEDVNLALTEGQAERESLTRWCVLLNRSLNRLDDRAAMQNVEQQTRDQDTLFALQAWAPVQRLSELQAFAADSGLVLEAVEPAPGEVPPTQFHNPEQIAGGEELVSFYMTPSYWLCDPSPVVFFSFALFFAMIMCDAGYGLVLCVLTLLLWKRMSGSPVARRWRTILAWLSGTTVVYGVLAGSYFGVVPQSGFLKSLQILNTNNYGQMMLLSALIGVVHITIANLMNAWRFGRSLRALAPVGWAAIIVGGMTLALGSKTGLAAARQIGIGALAFGAGLVVLFTAVGEPLGRRAIGGLLGLTKITSAFGDVLSYLRLFALGLASASLATVFNSAARGLYHKFAGLGLLFAIVLVVLGHGVNLILSIASAFIHGLRLNVIEFFNWGVQEEGTQYRPFVKKESTPWNP
jgi:V/A-type H+-transporting ATPase subunit I